MPPQGAPMPNGAAMPGPMPGGGVPHPPMPPQGGSQPGPQPGQPGAPAQLQPMGPQPNPMQGMFASMLAVVGKIQKAISLLRNDLTRGYRIDIESDSMVAGDIEAEREDAVEFLQAVTQFMAGMGPIVMQAPDFAPVAGKFLQFGVRKFRTGRDLEAAIDEYVDSLTKKAGAMAQAAANRPDPQMMLAQAKMQAEGLKAQAEMARAQLDMRAQQENDARQAQIEQQKHQMEIEKMAREEQMDRETHAMRMQELAAKLLEHHVKTGVAPPSGTLAGQQKEHLARIEAAADKMHKAAMIHHNAVNTPRRIIRGPDGRAVGVAPIQ
jgi:hypothetical protein